MSERTRYDRGDTKIIIEIMRALSECGPLERVELDVQDTIKLLVTYYRASEDASEPSDDTHDADEDCRQEFGAVVV